MIDKDTFGYAKGSSEMKQIVRVRSHLRNGNRVRAHRRQSPERTWRSKLYSSSWSWLLGGRLNPLYIFSEFVHAHFLFFSEGYAQRDFDERAISSSGPRPKKQEFFVQDGKKYRVERESGQAKIHFGPGKDDWWYATDEYIRSGGTHWE
jgi:hypothetical protein